MADSTGETMLINPAPTKPRQTRSYQAELTALQNRVDLAIVLLRGALENPKEPPLRIRIALETLQGTPQNGAAS